MWKERKGNKSVGAPVSDSAPRSQATQEEKSLRCRQITAPLHAEREAACLPPLHGSLVPGRPLRNAVLPLLWEARVVSNTEERVGSAVVSLHTGPRRPLWLPPSLFRVTSDALGEEPLGVVMFYLC